MAGRKSRVPINQLYEYVMTDNIYESVMIDSGSKASFVTVCLNETTKNDLILNSTPENRL